MIKLIASKENWIEGEAVRQLNKTAELPGMFYAVGLPDIHPGMGHPVGAAFLSEKIFYPHLLGNDIGCGMGLWITDLRKRKIKRDRWITKLGDLESQWDGDRTFVLEQEGLLPSSSDIGLGTIGGGNHFAELQVIEKVHDPEIFAKTGLDEDYLVLLIHSGSRGVGDSLFRSYAAKYKGGGISEDTEESQEYLSSYDHAVKWAKANRALIAARFLWDLGAEGRRILDIGHNLVTQINFENRRTWLHQKGAVFSQGCPVVISGSRGSMTYLVEPCGDQTQNAFCLPHGAGRKWKRGDIRQRLSSTYSAESLTHTKLGGRVICEDRTILYDEAPQAYKDIEVVIHDLIEANLIRIIAVFRPLITYKMKRRD